MTNTEALTLALKLAIQAPTEKKSQAALCRAKDIAMSMSSRAVEHCKMAAQAAIEYERQYGDAQ